MGVSSFNMPTLSPSFEDSPFVGKNNLETVYESDEQNDHIKKENRVGTKHCKIPALLKHRENIDILKAEKELDDARQEWEKVDTTVPGTSIIPLVSLHVTYEEVHCYLKTKDMSQYLLSIKPVRQRRGFDVLKYWLFGPPKLHNTLVHERNLIFAIAQCPFDTSEPLHVRVLQTIFKELTGTVTDCPRYGNHWEDIGFQGNDPATDLRGVGFLGLLHILYLTLNPRTADLAKEIYKFSHHEMQNFPFCVMGINMTRIVLETLREEVLNRECNKKGNVLEVVNEFYSGIYLHLYQIWRDQKKTILDSGYVLKDVSTFAKRNTFQVFQELLDYHQGKLKSSRWFSDVVHFSDIGDISQGLSGSLL